jgi:enediyne biosynthesis protein E4
MKPVYFLIGVVTVLAITAGNSRSRDDVPPTGRPFRFRDVTAEAGLEKYVRGALNHAVAWGDLDNDGRLDLFLGNFADRPGQPDDGKNRLFRQVEGGKFVPFPSSAVEVRGRCSGAVFVDLTNSGHLDLYVSSNHLEKPSPKEPQHTPQTQRCRLYRNEGRGKYVDISEECGACPATLFRCRDIGAFDFDNDGLLDLLVLQDQVVKLDGKVYGSRLFRNRGNHKFEDVTTRVGLPEDLWGLGIAVADLNGDRRPDFFIAGPNRLYLSQPAGTYKEAEALRPVLDPGPLKQGWVTGAVFGDLNGDGKMDLVTGPHDYGGPSPVQVFLNEGLKDRVPRFRNITKAIGIPVIPQKAPHPEIQDFDNDGIPDLYWSAYLAEGTKRWPFICRGLGVKDGLPRFHVPAVPAFDLMQMKRNAPPAKGVGMVYYVNGPAVDYDGDGKLDMFGGIWPEENSHLFHNETPGGNWLQVRVQGKRMNRMGVGAQVRVYAAGKVGVKSALLGCQTITLNGGYSSGRPALVHFGLGKAQTCDVEITLPSREKPLIAARALVNRLLVVPEP